MYFKLGKKRIIEAIMQNGLYIVTYITPGYEETAFLGTDIYTQMSSQSARMLSQELTAD